MKVKRYKQVYHVNINQKIGVANISDCSLESKENHQLNRKTIYTDKKRPLYKENIAIINVYASNNPVTKYVKEKPRGVKGEPNNSSYSWRLQHACSNTNRKTSLKISKDI